METGDPRSRGDRRPRPPAVRRRDRRTRTPRSTSTERGEARRPDRERPGQRAFHGGAGSRRQPRRAAGTRRRARASPLAPMARTPSASEDDREAGGGLGGKTAVAGVDRAGRRVQAADRLHENRQVSGLGRADGVDDRRAPSVTGTSAGPITGSVVPARATEAGDGAGGQVGLGLVRVRQVGEHRLAAGEHVDRRGGGGVAHDEAALAGRRRRRCR